MVTDLEQVRAWLLTEHDNTVCADRLHAVEWELRDVVRRRVPGAVVELGCYRGAMALWIRAILDELGDLNRPVHVYDSFRGMPTPGAHDTDHLVEGELRSSPGQVVDTHRRWGKAAPTIHAGWFDQVLPSAIPALVAFAYLDGDFFESTLTGLTYCVPRLTPGGVLLVDDYADTAVNPRAFDRLPGVKTACDSYFGLPSPVEVMVGDGDLALGRYVRSADAA